MLLVVLSAYSESPQQGEAPDSLDSTSVSVCPNSSSYPLGVLAPVLPPPLFYCNGAANQFQKSTPSVLVFEINLQNIKVSKTLKFEQEGETVVLDVRGLIYHGDFHFTSRIIGNDGMVS